MQMKNKKVIVAMSGGVDSSTAAALLKRAGFEVVGVFMKFWSESGGNRCYSPESETRARQIATKIGIPFYVFDFQKEFKKKIVDYFLKEYKEGLTPNPCVVCNKEIKFNLLLKKALALGGVLVATGHYARVEEDKDGYHLLKGRDKEKDQSYFLWQLSQSQLKRSLFPVGHYTKEEVRTLARELKLAVSDISESQEICFIPDSINDFLKKHLKANPGKIVDTNGKVLGKHQGLHFYTIGQRRGVRLSGGPYYVLEKDQKKNLLIVTKREKDLLQKELRVKNVNWMLGKSPRLPLLVIAKIRYGPKGGKAQVKRGDSKTLEVVFNKAQRAVAPGQSVVFYRKEELLGGGIIC